MDEEKKDAYTVVQLPRWLFILVGVVLGLLVLLATLNLSLNFLDSRARARFEVTLEERGKRIESLERRMDQLERSP